MVPINYFVQPENIIINHKLQNGLCYTGAVGLHGAFFGEGVGLILVDDTECIGNETTLLDCSHLGIGTSNCFHNEDVSVLCQGKENVQLTCNSF